MKKVFNLICLFFVTVSLTIEIIPFRAEAGQDEHKCT